MPHRVRATDTTRNPGGGARVAESGLPAARTRNLRSAKDTCCRDAAIASDLHRGEGMVVDSREPSSGDVSPHVSPICRIDALGPSGPLMPRNCRSDGSPGAR